MDKLRVGDTVDAAYFDEVAVNIEKASPGAPKMTSKAVERAGVAAMQSTVTSRIIAVDAAKDTVTIKGPKGAEHTLKVTDPDLQLRLKEVEAGREPRHHLHAGGRRLDRAGQEGRATQEDRAAQEAVTSADVAMGL